MLQKSMIMDLKSEASYAFDHQWRPVPGSAYGGSPSQSFTSQGGGGLSGGGSFGGQKSKLASEVFVKGLKVRMGVATGTLLPGTTVAGSHIMELAKCVGDAGAGGQILMCSSTFQAVKDLAGMDKA